MLSKAARRIFSFLHHWSIPVCHRLEKTLEKFRDVASSFPPLESTFTHSPIYVSYNSYFSYKYSKVHCKQELRQVVLHIFFLKQFGSEKYESGKKLWNFIYTIYGSQCFGSTLSSMLFTVWYRHEAWFPFNLIPHDIFWKYEHQIWPTVLVVVFEETFEICQWGAFAFISYVNLVYLHTTSVTMTILQKNSTTTSWTLKDLEETLLIYSKLRVLNTMYDNTFRYTFHPVFNTICGAMVVTCMFLLMKTSKIDDPSVFGLCLCLGTACNLRNVAVANFTSCISTDSANLHDSLRQRARNRIQHCFTKSFCAFGKLKWVLCIECHVAHL
ncbi:hypothetical protein Ocin01_13568 [Orchesella cincta]|uniref:Uncharacterized protein n=1 Tax=Orchesella cincta TaxID=48709 RepID=A0A1D2MJA0_ORCCI|nr:hypothetical protein Ocin01_13568 [Orchesella cincta]